MKKIAAKINTMFMHLRQRIWKIMSAFPFVTFVVVLLAVIAILVLGVKLRQPATIAAEEETTTTVKTYQVGQTPELVVQAKVDKAGVINIVALTGGVVNKIPVKAGQTVKSGTTLVRMGSNYQGGNAASLSRQSAQKSYDFVAETFDTEKEIINKNRELANKAETLESELRSISRASIDDTKGLISLNEEIITGIDEQIDLLESMNCCGIFDGDILSLNTLKSQIFSGLSAARSGLRSTEYASSESQEPAEIARLTRDITLKQLDIQEKSLVLNKDLAALSVKIARINESMFFPTAPCGGVIERIHVKEGQQVTPGTVLISMVTQDDTTSLIGLVPGDVAERVTPYGEVSISKGNDKLTGSITYVSQEPTEAGLHSILVSIPDGLGDEVWQDQIVKLHVALGAAGLGDGLQPFVPIDAVYQTKNEAFVYIVKPGDDGKSRAEIRKLELGEVFGDSVLVDSGLTSGDQVITTRNVAAGNLVSIE